MEKPIVILPSILGPPETLVPREPGLSEPSESTRISPLICCALPLAFPEPSGIRACGPCGPDWQVSELLPDSFKPRGKTESAGRGHGNEAVLGSMVEGYSSQFRAASNLVVPMACLLIFDFMCMEFRLHLCLCTVCMQCLRSPEEGSTARWSSRWLRGTCGFLEL